MLTCDHCENSFRPSEIAFVAGYQVCPACRKHLRVYFDCTKCGRSVWGITELLLTLCPTCRAPLCRDCVPPPQPSSS